MAFGSKTFKFFFYPSISLRAIMSLMKPIHFETGLFVADTYGQKAPRPTLPELAEPFAVQAGKKASIGVVSNDEIPFFFAVDGLLGAAKISLEDATKETFVNRLHAAFTQYNVDPSKVEVYMGPCLTFSHTFVERKLIEEMMDRGNRAACKRTDGVDFLDVPLLVLMQCRRLGVKMENIHISDYDTFENPELLSSKLRGDSSDNLTVATLR